MFEFLLAFTLHTGLSRDMNEVHPHIRWQEDTVAAGVFENSLGRASVYVAKDHGVVEYGLATGYDIPVAPFVRVKTTNDQINLFAAPAYDRGEVGAVFGLEFEL